ncbi:MAG: helix-turn-helix transcriptional regulator [Lachnospira sp.]|nr:helix-turn-helix transcriptional regulator [Lachnospira sp.]
MDDNKIGMNIKKYRKGKFTQQELADKIGKTESSIRKYEKGLVTIPLDVLYRIATALEVKIADLMGISDYWEDAEQAIHETTSFKDYLGVLGYDVHESPYNDKWVIRIKESNADIYISNEEMDTLERTTKENIDLRITKYMSDGKHNQ